MRPTTRPISCLTLDSRSGVFRCPRKYFDTTTLVGQLRPARGNSQSACSKMTSPFSLPMVAVRRSHSTASRGSIPSLLKCRGTATPLGVFAPFRARTTRVNGWCVPAVEAPAMRFGSRSCLRYGHQWRPRASPSRVRDCLERSQSGVVSRTDANSRDERGPGDPPGPQSQGRSSFPPQARFLPTTACLRTPPGRRRDFHPRLSRDTRGA